MNINDHRESLIDALAVHRAGGYFAAPDGHRECYCGHVMAADESYEAHAADALLASPALARLLAAVWDEGFATADNYVHAGTKTPCAVVDPGNPYRGGAR